METGPKVVVIIPCFNASETIEQTLKSVEGQTYRNYDVLIINDGSTDGTEELVLSYRDRTGKAWRVITQPNMGQTVAKNTGILNSNSEYIAFLDSDDVWAPEKLEYQVNLMMSNHDVGLCYTGGMLINEQGDNIGLIHCSDIYRGKCYDSLLLKNNIIASSVMVRRKVLDKVGVFDERFRACENWDLWIRVSKISQIEYIDKALTYYRVHPGNMSRNVSKMFQARIEIIDKYLPAIGHDQPMGKDRRRALYFAYLAFSKQHIEALELKEARDKIVNAIKLSPFKFTCHKILLKTFLGKNLLRLIRRMRKATPINGNPIGQKANLFK